MNLETLRLVAFALSAESNGGVLSKSPAIIQLTFESIQSLPEEAIRRAFYASGIIHLLDNYLTVWGNVEEETKKPERAVPGSPGTFDIDRGIIVPKKEEEPHDDTAQQKAEVTVGQADSDAGAERYLATEQDARGDAGLSKGKTPTGPSKSRKRK